MLSEFATEGTYWNEGAGGNVTRTVMDGKHYERKEPWTLTVSRYTGGGWVDCSRRVDGAERDGGCWSGGQSLSQERLLEWVESAKTVEDVEKIEGTGISKS